MYDIARAPKAGTRLLLLVWKSVVPFCRSGGIGGVRCRDERAWATLHPTDVDADG